MISYKYQARHSRTPHCLSSLLLKAMEKAESFKSKEKQEVIHFHGSIGTVGAIGGSGHTITLSSAGRVHRKTEPNPGQGSISYNLTLLMSASHWLRASYPFFVAKVLEVDVRLYNV